MKSKARALQGATYPVTISTPFGVLRYVYTVDSRGASFLLADASPRLKSGEADGFLSVLPEILAGVGIAAGHDCGAVARHACECCSGESVSA